MIKWTIIFILFLSSGAGAQPMFLCGPDEDGCYPEIYQYCLCIPHAGKMAKQPYCLDFTSLNCLPRQDTQCEPGQIELANQGRCLATLYHSDPSISCQLTDGFYCSFHQITISELS